MTTANCFYRTSIKALITDEQKRFLLVREDNGLWELPGGWLDHGEDVYDCLRREIHEEMWLTVTHIEKRPAYFLSAQQWDNGAWKTIAVYHTQVEHLEFTPSQECQEVRFFTPKEALCVPLYPSITAFIQQYTF